MITRQVEFFQHEFINGTVYYVQFSAAVPGVSSWHDDGELIDCGMFESYDKNAVIAAANAWTGGASDNDDLAIELTELLLNYDPFCGVEYGECLKEHIDALATIEGTRDVLRGMIELFQEAAAE